METECLITTHSWQVPNSKRPSDWGTVEHLGFLKDDFPSIQGGYHSTFGVLISSP